MFKWTNRDWAWLVIFLVCIIIAILSLTLSGGNVGAILSIALTVTATILSVVTIVLSIMQNGTMDNKLHDLDRKLDRISDLRDDVKALTSRIQLEQTLETLKAVRSGKELSSAQATHLNEIIEDFEATDEKMTAISDSKDLFNSL